MEPFETVFNWETAQDLSNTTVLSEYDVLASLITDFKSSKSTDSFNEIYRIIMPKLVNKAKSYAKESKLDAEELSQEAISIFYEKLDQLKEPRSAIKWLYTILHSCVTATTSKKAFQNELLVDEDSDYVFDNLQDTSVYSSPQTFLDEKETVRLLREMISSLPAEQYRVVMYHFGEELSFEQIAEIEGVSVSTVKSRMRYAEKKVKSQVLSLEKKGTKLYSLTWPMLFLLLRNMLHSDASTLSSQSKAALYSYAKAAARVSSVVAGTAASTAGVAETIGTIGGATEAAGTAGTAGVAGAVGAAGAAGVGFFSTITGKAIAAVLALAIVGGGGAAVIRGIENIANSAHALNPSEYIVLDYEGIDGYGKVNVSIDYDKLAAATFDDKKKQERYKSYYGEQYAMAGYAQDISEHITYSANKTDSLSNSDRVEVTLSYDEEWFKSMNIKLKKETTSFTVNSLEAPKYFDPFENIQMTFTGISEEGRASYEVIGNSVYTNITEHPNYSLDKTEDLSNGDTIIMTYNFTNDDTARYGYLLTSTTKEYTVNGLDYYVKDAAQLPSSFLDQLVADADAAVAARIENGSIIKGVNRPTSILTWYTDPPKMIKYQFAVANGEPIWSDSVALFGGEIYNRICILYEINVSTVLTSKKTPIPEGTGTTYVAVEYGNVVASIDGIVEYDSNLLSVKTYKVNTPMEETYNEDVVNKMTLIDLRQHRIIGQKAVFNTKKPRTEFNSVFSTPIVRIKAH